ncbi:MAG: hypothetical protein VX642_04185 [Bdellovibrionota bacterium]|nr:hypothetical protein [Bdellovibrionota bacterium]
MANQLPSKCSSSPKINFGLDPELYNKESFQEIKRISEELLKKCEGPNCSIVGIGRSPAILLRYIESVSKQSSIELPFSTKKLFDEEVSELSLDSPLPLNLVRHFDKYIPQNQDKVLIVDFSFMGTSLITAAEFLNSYFKSKGIPTIVEVVAILQMKYDFESFQSYANSRGIKVTKKNSLYALDPNSDFSKLAWEMAAFKQSASQFKSFDILGDQNVESSERNQIESINEWILSLQN